MKKIVREELVRYLLKKANVKENFIECSFESYIVEDGNKKALEKAKEFAEKFLNNNEKLKGIYFFGPVGVGKTHLSVSILRHIAEKTVERAYNELKNIVDNQPEFDQKETLKNALDSWLQVNVYFTTTQEYIRKLMSLFGDKKQIEFSERVISTELLVVDDLGTETLSNWSLEEIFYVISYRYERGLPTIFTSNYDLADLYGKYIKKLPPIEIEKMLSRIKGFTEGVKIIGEDKRKKNL